LTQPFTYKLALARRRFGQKGTAISRAIIIRARRRGGRLLLKNRSLPRHIKA
jgi:hypothetical protein